MIGVLEKTKGSLIKALFPTNKLLAYYKFESIENDKIIDRYGPYHATNNGARQTEVGKLGKGVYLETNDWIDLSALNNIWNGTDWTVGLWVKFDTISNNSRVLQNRGQGAFGTKKGFQINGRDFNNLGIDKGDGNYIKFAGTNLPNLTWHLLALSWKSDAGRATLRVNNVAPEIKTNANMIGCDLNGEGLLLGKSNQNAQYLTGYVDEMFVFQKEITDEEYDLIWNGGNGRTLK